MNADDCFKQRLLSAYCASYGKCRLGEKTDEQLAYVLHPLDQGSYLKACPGSGKTEAVALKAAYALRTEQWRHAGIAFLSFTNHAADVIKERVSQSNDKVYPHYIGTFNSWLHGYILNPHSWRFTKYDGRANDRSVRIVEANSRAGFLSRFKTRYAYSQHQKVSANEYFIEGGRFVFDSDNDGMDAARNAHSLADWEIDDLTDTKVRFWQSGFATHQDVETLCYYVLRDLPIVCAQVARRFPYLVIDECQDLCPSQLQLLSALENAGTKVHFVGDLNQSIFSFRGSDPAGLLHHIEERALTQLEFTENFRSVQPIVELCGRVVSQQEVRGQPPVSNEPACVYFSFNGAGELPLLAGRFETWLRGRGLDPKKCAIIARGSSTLAKLVGRQNEVPRGSAHRIAVAIRDWKNKDAASRRNALKHFGAVLASRHFPDESADGNAYYCPHSIESNIDWRLFLAKALDSVVAEPQLANFQQTWSQWTKAARQHIPSITATAWKAPPTLAAATEEIRAPQGKGGEQVAVALGINAGVTSQLYFTNIHQIKGQTFDAVLVVSSPTRQGDGGHWTHWLDRDPAHDEHRRFAYVASSRPRLILAWAVPTPNAADQQRLTELGFVTA